MDRDAILKEMPTGGEGGALLLGHVDAPARLVHGEASGLGPVLSLLVTFSVATSKMRSHHH
jgi:hypothetical protein